MPSIPSARSGSSSDRTRFFFYLGESGFVKEFRLPPLLPLLEQLNGLNAQQQTPEVTCRPSL
jgi:hypothetical protein